jgi:hypothetical protein
MGTRSRSFLPDDIQSALIYWRDQFREGYFEIGDIASRVIETFGERGVAMTQAAIFAEIGRFCGKSGRTVRYYYETALFYPAPVRAQYSHLSFSHFVVARAFGEAWQEVLEFAALEPSIASDALRMRWLSAASETGGQVIDASSPSPVEEDSASGNKLSETGVDVDKIRRHAWLSNIDKLASVASFFEEQLEYLPEHHPTCYQIRNTLKEIYAVLPQLVSLIDYLPPV